MIFNKQKDIDLGLGGVTLRNDRVHVVNYLHPHWDDRFSFATTPIKSEHNIGQFLHPFSFNVWLALLLSFIMFYLFDRLMSMTITRRNRYHCHHKHCVWIALRLLFRQPYQWKIGKKKVATFQSQRIIIGIWLLITVILTSIYSGCIQSELTVPDSNAIDSIDKLADACESKRITLISTEKDFSFFRVSIFIV